MPIIGPYTNVPVQHRYNTPSPKTVLRGDPKTDLRCFFSGKYVNPSVLLSFTLHTYINKKFDLRKNV